MNMFIDLTKRNIKLYWRDKSTVFVSLLSSIIIIALFVLFLGRQYINNTVEMFSEFGVTDSDSIGTLIFSWVLAGIVVLNSISIPQMMLSRIIHDRESKTLNDFYTIPFNRSILGFSYIASALLVGTVVTFISFMVGEFYIFMFYGQYYSVMTHLLVLGFILLSTTSFSALMFLIYSFIKTSSAIGGITAFTSSVGGFLAGIYITIGGLTGITKDIISSNPLAHATTLLRTILMNPIMETLFKDVPSETVKGFSDIMAVNLYVGNSELTSSHFIISLLGLAVICFVFSYFKLLRDKI